MSYRPAFELATYDTLGDGWRRGILVALVEVLVLADRAYLHDHPEVPSIYASGVRYVFNYDRWQDLPAMLERGEGDCKDLAAWRVAELRNQGIWASVDVISRTVMSPKGPLIVYHVRVLRPDGVVEDPSRRQGMPETGGIAPGMGI